MHQEHILVVDDEAAERITLGEILRLEGYQVTLAASGEETLALIDAGGPFNAVILDLQLPGIDGLQVLAAIQEIAPGMLVILITGYATVETAIQALREDAYHYLLKPAPPEQILITLREGLDQVGREQHRQMLVAKLKKNAQELASIEKNLPEPPPVRDDDLLQVDNIIIDRAKHLVVRDGEPIDLTPTEFRLLECLLEDADQVRSPQELVRCAQGYETDTRGARSIIRVHIRRLRSKIEPAPSRPRYILNVRGVGYMFDSTSERVT
ncbi:MAG TPA: response regulator transcription factor [Thermoflexia bacterium]|nr:response regulator transcription factor [Thermoflexia bacterium]